MTYEQVPEGTFISVPAALVMVVPEIWFLPVTVTLME
jgi:hypothetical protein